MLKIRSIPTCGRTTACQVLGTQTHLLPPNPGMGCRITTRQVQLGTHLAHLPALDLTHMDIPRNIVPAWQRVLAVTQCRVYDRNGTTHDRCQDLIRPNTRLLARVENRASQGDSLYPYTCNVTRSHCRPISAWYGSKLSCSKQLAKTLTRMHRDGTDPLC